MKFADRIIIALDVDTRSEALELVRKLRGKVGLFKVGSQLFTAEGPELVREIAGLGEKVFLDLKYHDIPNTVVKAVLAAERLGVSMLTLHAAGGKMMMSAVAQALKGANRSDLTPIILAVTVLTSLGDHDLKEIGCHSASREQVLRLTHLAQQSGMNGVVASPTELPALRERFGNSLLLVTPGIRPSGKDTDDQIRIATPLATVQAGADYLVIGRPVTASRDPAQSLETILVELSQL